MLNSHARQADSTTVSGSLRVEAQAVLTKAPVQPQGSDCFAAERAPHTLTTAEAVHRGDVEQVDHQEPDDHADDHDRETRHDAGSEVEKVDPNLPDGGRDADLRPQQMSEMTEESESC